MSKVAINLKNVIERINSTANKRPEQLKYFVPRLVAVSKLKSTKEIIEAYNAGQRHFGENYVKELYEKSNSADIISSCPEIKWHFIGNLQSSKINKVASIPNLYMIETLDSIQLADKLNKAVSSKSAKNNAANKNLLKIMIQVNTSKESQKNGIDPKSVADLYSHIVNNCKSLDLAGLMTIGSVEQSINSDINNDFKNLVNCKLELVEKLKLDPKKIELSMGMSNDFENAILMGSSSVRVGSLIFGERK